MHNHSNHCKYHYVRLLILMNVLYNSFASFALTLRYNTHNDSSALSCFRFLFMIECHICYHILKYYGFLPCKKTRFYAYCHALVKTLLTRHTHYTRQVLLISRSGESNAAIYVAPNPLLCTLYLNKI